MGVRGRRVSTARVVDTAEGDDDGCLMVDEMAPVEGIELVAMSASCRQTQREKKKKKKGLVSVSYPLRRRGKGIKIQ